MAEPVAFLEPLKTLHETRSEEVFGMFVVFLGQTYEKQTDHLRSTSVRD